MITIWAERYGPIDSLEFEWSFGSSAAAEGRGHRKLGYTMMTDGRVLRMGMSAHVDGRPVDASARVTIAVNGRGRGLGTHTTKQLSWNYSIRSTIGVT